MWLSSLASSCWLIIFLHQLNQNDTVLVLGQVSPLGAQVASVLSSYVSRLIYIWQQRADFTEALPRKLFFLLLLSELLFFISILIPASWALSPPSLVSTEIHFASFGCTLFLLSSFIYLQLMFLSLPAWCPSMNVGNTAQDGCKDRGEISITYEMEESNSSSTNWD